MTRIELAGLRAALIGPDDATRTAVLCHGFGASGDDLVPLARELALPNVRFVFPAAPLELGGFYGAGRAWWPLDLERIERELRAATGVDRSAEVPDGLHAARAQLSRFLDELVARYAIAPDRLVLGGFSQGAMTALDAALHRTAPPAGLVLWSTTLIAGDEWGARMPTLANVPIALSHGRHDPLLPFAVAERLRDQLRAAGAAVEFVEFAGGHEIPAPALAAAVTILRGR
jgi:phospholipase/carboxylesterase